MLKELIARLEKATGPDRELDGMIFKLIDERPGDRWVPMERDDREVWFRECREERMAFIGPAYYTASLDAAMRLVGLDDGWLPYIECEWRAQQGCLIWEVQLGHMACDATDHVFHRSLPIALCVAALEAREASGFDGHRTGATETARNMTTTDGGDTK